MLRMACIVSDVTQERATFIIREMPLKMVFGYEHFYYLKNGFDCKVLSFEQSLEDLMSSL
jgi:hypothetical protein